MFFRSSSKTILFSSLSFAGVLLLSALFFFLQAKGVIFEEKRTSALLEDILPLWQEENYEEVFRMAEQGLIRTPSQPEYLYLRGASAFYLSTVQLLPKDQQFYLEETVSHLNRLLLLKPDFEEIAEVYYLLGRALSLRGEYFSDEGNYYLLKAEEGGVQADDLDEYIGLNYFYLGDLRESLVYLKKIPAEGSSKAFKEKIKEIEGELEREGEVEPQLF